MPNARGGRAKVRGEIMACMKEFFEQEPEGKLSVEDLKKQLAEKCQLPDFKHKGCKRNIDKILGRMVEKMDKDDDDKISLEEFEKFMEEKMGQSLEGDD